MQNAKCRIKNNSQSSILNSQFLIFNLVNGTFHTGKETCQ